MNSADLTGAPGFSQSPMVPDERFPLRLLPDLRAVAEEIRQRRPDTVVIGNEEIAVDYRVDAGTGAEYAAIDVELPDPWFMELDSECSAFETFGQIWSVCLLLD